MEAHSHRSGADRKKHYCTRPPKYIKNTTAQRILEGNEPTDTAAVVGEQETEDERETQGEASATTRPVSQELRSKEGNERERGGASRWHLLTPSDTKTPRDLVQTCSALAKLQVQVQG